MSSGVYDRKEVVKKYFNGKQIKTFFDREISAESEGLRGGESERKAREESWSGSENVADTTGIISNLEIRNVHRSSSASHGVERLEGAVNEGVSGWRLCARRGSRVRANGVSAALIFGR